MLSADLVFLPEHDVEYQEWVRQYPHGFVINAHKNAAYPMYWHRADCGHIQPNGILRFVEGEFIKACSLNPGELAAWAKPRSEGLNYCKDCRSRWLNEAKGTA